MSSFYDNHERWQEIVNQMQGTSIQPVYDDADFYIEKPLTTGMTVKFKKDKEGTLYEVVQVHRNGNVLLIDANNEIKWASYDDLLVAENSTNPANKKYDGTGLEFVDVVMAPKDEEVITWKLAWIDSGFKEDDIVDLEDGRQGVIVGKIRGRSHIASYDALGNMELMWVDDSELKYSSKQIEEGGSLPSEYEVNVAFNIIPTFGFYDTMKKTEAKNREAMLDE